MDLDLSDIDLAENVRMVDEHPVSQGGYSDIYLGSWTRSPQAGTIQVAIKVIISRRSNQDTDRRIKRRLTREISTWRNLDHPRIIKLYGISSSFGKFPALVSPWYNNGDARAFLRAHPNANRHKLLRGVVAAVQYLHGLQPAVAHGDIKAANVLVQDDGEACLGDFGLSRFIQHVSTGFTTTVFSGTPRWMAPELLFSKNDDVAPVTKEGDVYALGCLALELTTNECPWYSIRNDFEFMSKVRKGSFSPRPKNEVAARELPDELWALIKSCWSYKPSKRPQITFVHERLISIIGVDLPEVARVPGLAAGAPVLQGIIAAFARVQFNKEQCQLLRDSSEKCFQAINDDWKLESESILAPAVDKFVELLIEIRTSMVTYASYNRLESFIKRFNVASDVELKLKLLDQTLAQFGLAIAQHKWSQEFAVARQNDSGNLTEVLNGQVDVRDLNSENRAALDRVLRDLQALLRQQAPGPAQRSTETKILTIQSISNVGLPEIGLLSKIECLRIGSEPVAGTTTYEIWEGLWMGQQKVALKVLRGLRLEEMEKYKKRCERQVNIWSKLHSEYILPLYGICSDDGPFPYLVSPWCPNGDANRYLKDKPAVDRLKICLEAAYGLRYLHSLQEPIIHGAMKGSNILISNDGKALLADFGMSNIIESPFTQSNGPGASFRWMAPEMQGGEYTKVCNIWAWGMTTLELVSGMQPFTSIKMPGTVLLKIAQGERPNAKEYNSTVLKGDLWSLLELCWDKDPEKRPSIDVVVKKMEAILEAHHHA